MAAKARIPRRLREQVRERAGGHCEYCLVHERYSIKSYQADHIIAEKHGGQAASENLAWSCAVCNYLKGADLTSIDPSSGKITPLFNPRTQRWSRHFRLRGARIEPLTAIGRTTVHLLRLNDTERLDERELLVHFGMYPR